MSRLTMTLDVLRGMFHEAGINASVGQADFVLDAITRHLSQTAERGEADGPVAQFVETYWNRHANGEVSFVRLPIAEFPEWVLESNTYDVFRSSPPIDDPASKR